MPSVGHTPCVQVCLDVHMSCSIEGCAFCLGSVCAVQCSVDTFQLRFAVESEISFWFSEKGHANVFCCASCEVLAQLRCVSASIEILRQLPFGNVFAAWFATRRVSEDLS